ncbi:MAG: hypothetical protein IKI31_00935, partial [Treponema sp.]|nr:hypothetical protein [Treponema sp.]
RQVEKIQNPFEKGETLLLAWKNFRRFVLSKTRCYERAIFSVTKGVFLKALENYSQLFEEKDPLQKAEIFRKAGICYKKLGRFEEAKKCLSSANSFQPAFAKGIAELADCYALCGNDKNAKLLFKEAFFIAPEKIDIEMLDSDLITSLIQKTREKGYDGNVLLNWIPVYGTIWGLFTIKRKLNENEAVKLKQEIYAIEMEMKKPSSDDLILTPRLINLYFWLVDYYMLHDTNIKLVKDVLLKIKILDATIHDMYIK